MLLRKSLIMAMAGVSMIGIAAATPALADTNTGNTTTLSMVGSDTTQDVMEALSNQIKDSSGNPVLSNYKAVGGAAISTRSGVANCTFSRPVGSGAGLNALAAAIGGKGYGSAPNTSPNISGCVDVARSSSGSDPSSGAGAGTLTYIPFATDSVTFATLGISDVGHKLAKADLVSIYSANASDPLCSIYSPLLPQAGSGTRNFFLGQLGFTSNTINTPGGPGTCVKDTTPSGQPIIENDGRYLTNGAQLIPFSTAQYIAQGGDVTTNTLGRAALGSIDFGAASGAPLTNAQSPVQLKTSFTFNRPVYNVVSSAALSDPRVASTFVGPNSAVCSADTTVSQYGFAIPGNCGDTTKKSTK